MLRRGAVAAMVDPPLARRPALCAVALLGSVPFAGQALAQGRPVTGPVDTVNSRARPEYDAVGIALGGFTVLPDVALALAYDDNVYRTPSAKRDDGYAEVRPHIAIVSTSERYPLSLDASATLRRYASLQTENSEQYALSTAAAAEIAPGTRLSATGGYSRQLEPRGTAGDTFVGGEPIRYRLLSGSVSAARDVGGIGLEAGGGIDRYRYEDAVIGGARFYQRFRDYRHTQAHARIRYSVSPAIAAFLRGGIDRSQYPRLGGIDRNSKGYSVLAGVQMGLSNLVSGSIGVGYLRQSFSDPASGTVSGLDYDVALNWNPTPLIAVSLGGGRSVQRSPFADSPGGIQTTLNASVDYELLRQLILSANLRTSRVTYRGVDRADRYADAQLGARYLMNRTAALTLTVNYRRQSSSGLAARDFNGFGAAIGVTLHR